MRGQRAHDDSRRDKEGENMSERYVLRVELTTHDGIHYESVCNVQNLIHGKLGDWFDVKTTEIKEIVSA